MVDSVTILRGTGDKETIRNALVADRYDVVDEDDSYMVVQVEDGGGETVAELDVAS